MYTRPKPGETEEDLLRLQEEFFKNKSENKFKPAAKLITNNTNVKNADESQKNNETVKTAPNIPEGAVMGRIIERKSVEMKSIDESNFKFSGGFPKAKRRQGDAPARKGVSIFAQQNKKIRGDSPEINSPQTSKINTPNIKPMNEFVRFKNIPEKSYILTGDEKYKIHEENVEKLSGLSEEEIMEEQQKLMSNLDPEIIKFLKSKREKNEPQQEKMEIEETREVDVSVEQIATTKEIIYNPDSDKWLHFDSVETEKFQWMKDIKLPKSLKSGEPYEARFDFSGWLLPYAEEEISEKTRSLYHHGDESGRPGYTLQELFKLCRSSVPQQRILALNTISNILSLNTTGVYENVIDIPIEQVFFVVRVALDENVPTVLNASIKALHSIFCYQIDETCLDGLTGFGIYVQPTLSVEDEKVNKDDEKEINDQQLAEMDLVKCLARTDILIRIRYIINTVMPSLETVNYCLMILIRLMRDSRSIMTDVYNCEDLFKSIIKHFVPKTSKLSSSNSAYGTPVPSAIKLLRIAASRSKHIAQELIERHNIMDSICLYLANDLARNTNEVKVQSESLHLFAVMLHYNLAKPYIVSIKGIIMRSLAYHIHNTSMEDSTYALQNHFSGILNVISQLAAKDIYSANDFINLLIMSCTKYTTQTSKLSDFKCGKLQIISSLLLCLANFTEVNSVIAETENCIESLLGSEGFSKITKNIKIGSNLLCPYEAYKTSPNLSTVQASVWGTSEHVVPSLQTNSCVPFLMAVASYIKCSSIKLQLLFLRHPSINNYLSQLRNAPKLNLVSNWFSRIESKFLMDVLKCSVNVQQSLTNVSSYYELAVKTLGVYNHEQKEDVAYILKNIVFNKNFYGNEVMLKNLSLDDRKDILNCLDNVEQMYECYVQILDLKKKSFIFVSNLCLDIRLGNLLPIDWIFSPIISLYSQQQSKSQKDEESDLPILKITLQWIFLYEYYFPELASSINVLDRYCRLACVFLCSNSLFLDDHIHKLLEYCFKILISENNFKSINFDKEIQGLNNFQDFYTQLLEQYQAVSYGDPLFANFILLPIVQRFNVKWRKVFWSEYAGVAQTLSLREDQILINIEEFLQPYETDVSLLKNYMMCMREGYLNRSPFLRKITTNHLENYRKMQK